MDKAELDQFIEYYRPHRILRGSPYNDVAHAYKKFGREFIHSLPVEYKTDPADGQRYTVVQGTDWEHSVSGPVYVYNNVPIFFILSYWLTLDEWLPYCALSPEEQLLCKLKYG